MDSIYSNPTRQRINKIFDNHIITDNSEALYTISGLCSSNSTNKKNKRRILVNEIEKRDLMVNKEILAEYSKVKEKLQVLLDSLASLDASVTDMSNRLQESKTKTHHIISQTNKLKDDRKKTKKKLVWVNAFVKNFEINSDHSKCIYNLSPLTLDFFHNLNEIERLNDNCKTLVKCWYQTPAFDIMENIGLQQEVAIEKLYHWTIGACVTADSPNNALIPKSLAKLENRQVLFSNIIDEYCTARKARIVQLFIDVLTKGGENGSKPIEFYANDIKRYIGDILAWVYQVIPLEKENLSTLFKHCNMPDKDSRIATALTSIMEALCPLLKVRAELILKPDKDPLVLWSITNLIMYYRDTIQALITDGHLINTFNELLRKSEEVFLVTLDNKVQKELSHGVKAPPSDLNPSYVVTDLVSFLRDLMGVTSDGNGPDKKIMITHILDPLLHAINETACHLSSTDMSVYMLNCLYHIQCTLSLYTILDDYNERLQAQSEAQIDTLTSEQASFLVANLNMGPIYTILQEKINGPLSAIPGMDTTTLKSFLNKFDMFLVKPDMYTLPQLNLLISHTHKTFVKKRSFEVILAIYQQLYQAIHNPSNGYIEPEGIVRRTPEEVNKLLI